jgi:N-acetylneuraminic acid mutarotase
MHPWFLRCLNGSSGRLIFVLCISFLLHCATFLPAAAQTGDWTWMGGSSVIGAPGCGLCGIPGTYGTLGTAAPGNVPGGRNGAATWTDSNGNLWLLGGQGFDSVGGEYYLNDFWKLDLSTAEWTWMGGSKVAGSTIGTGPAGVYGIPGTFGAAYFPGGRENAVNWVDPHGNFWLFGGWGADSLGKIGALNDLWEYKPSLRQWAYIGGTPLANRPPVYGIMGLPSATNLPGGRSQAVGGADAAGNLWLFGGLGYGAGNPVIQLNDLWEYSPSTGYWTWWTGSQTSGSDRLLSGQPGVYGTLGVPASANTPGGRTNSVAWVDTLGSLWLFGGGGFDSNGISTALNDLWMFNTSSHEWTWMGGSSTADTAGPGHPGVYGAIGVPALSNLPGDRESAAAWSDSKGNFWLFGGWGYDSAGILGWLNDLWQFNPSSGEWVWVSGDDTLSFGTFGPRYGQLGVYGTLGVPAAANVPGTRLLSSGWTDTNGNIWLFGGQGYDSVEAAGDLNDLWEYFTPTITPQTARPAFSVAGGTYIATQSITISDLTPNATIYYTTDGTTPTTASMVFTGPITVASNQTVEAVAVAGGYSISAVASASYTITPPAASPAFSVPAGTYTSVQTISIADATPNATIYYTTDGSTPTTGSTVYVSPIAVSSTETINAIAAASGYSASAMASATYTINLPQPNFTILASPASLTVSSGGKGTATLTVTPQNGFSAAVSFACSGLGAGASCVFSPTSVTPSGAAATTTLTITAQTLSAILRARPAPFFPRLIPALVLGILWPRRWRRCLVVLLATGLAALTFLSACGGSGSQPPPSSTSTVTVTATSGSIQQTATITLTVN